MDHYNKKELFEIIACKHTLYLHEKEWYLLLSSSSSFLRITTLIKSDKWFILLTSEITRSHDHGCSNVFNMRTDVKGGRATAWGGYTAVSIYLHVGRCNDRPLWGIILFLRLSPSGIACDISGFSTVIVKPSDITCMGSYNEGFSYSYAGQ